MSLLIEKDNSKIGRADHPIIKELANKDVSVLDKENFIIFPQHLVESEDLDHDNYVFQQRNNETWTCNIVGIISDGTDEIRINSRFTKEGKEDFFLKVYDGTSVELQYCKQPNWFIKREELL